MTDKASLAWRRGYEAAKEENKGRSDGWKRTVYNVIEAFREVALTKGWSDQAEEYRGRLDWLKEREGEE